MDMAPDPDVYAIHYRFLETLRRVVRLRHGRRARPGPLADPRHRPARRRPAQGLPRQRPADPPAGARRDRAGRRRRSYALGTRRGLDACASARGTFAVLALDHRQNLRRELRPDDPAAVTYEEMVAFKRAVVRALAPVATGTLLDPEIGAAQCIADGSLPGSAGTARRDRGDRLRGAIDGPDQPGPRRLERRAGEADRGVGRQAPRLLPPRGRERRRPGTPRRRRRGRLPRRRHRAVRRAPLVLARRGRAPDRRGPAPRRHRDRAPADARSAATSSRPSSPTTRR